MRMDSISVALLEQSDSMSFYDILEITQDFNPERYNRAVGIFYRGEFIIYKVDTLYGGFVHDEGSDIWLKCGD